MSRVDSYEKKRTSGRVMRRHFEAIGEKCRAIDRKPLHFDKCNLYQILAGVGLLSISRLVDNIITPMHAQYGLITPSGYWGILVQLQYHSWRIELYQNVFKNVTVTLSTPSILKPVILASILYIFFQWDVCIRWVRSIFISTDPRGPFSAKTL